MILSGYDKLSQKKRLWIIGLIHPLALRKARNVCFNAIWIRLCTQWPNQLKFNHKLQKKKKSHQMYPVFNDSTITIQFRHEQYSPPVDSELHSWAKQWSGLEGRALGYFSSRPPPKKGSGDKVLWSHSDLAMPWVTLVILLTFRMVFEVSANF